MNFSDIEDIYRSRITLLDILDLRGYDTAPFRKFSPLEISKAMFTAESSKSHEGFSSLSFVAKKLDPEDSKVCMVQYSTITRQKLMDYFNDYPTSDLAEVIVMIMDPVIDIHHQLALSLYMAKNIYVSFFSVFHLVNNPLNHVLVPKHEILGEEEELAVMKQYHIGTKSKFPLIKYHIDPIVRLIGAVPGNILKITRPSQTAGITVYYRCVSS